jgi:DNA-binding transcriptional LysR family regulator
MEISWLEDFLSLARTRNFSRSAEERNVTQPAFSRRIKSLEVWLGADLVDRSAYPTTLTPAGKVFRDVAEQVLVQLTDTREMLRGQQRFVPKTVHIRVAHTLASTFFPRWIEHVEARFGKIVPRVLATNAHDGMLALAEGGSCDFLVIYHHPQILLPLDEGRYPFLTLGLERMIPASIPDAAGVPVYSLDSASDKPLLFLAYTTNLFLGRVVEAILQRRPGAGRLMRVYETDLAEALKSMLLAGKGIGWAPANLIAQELHDGRLVPAGGADWESSFEVRIYHSVENRNPLATRLWSFLKASEGEVVVPGFELSGEGQAQRPASNASR